MFLNGNIINPVGSNCNSFFAYLFNFVKEQAKTDDYSTEIDFRCNGIAGHLRVFAL